MANEGVFDTNGNPIEPDTRNIHEILLLTRKIYTKLEPTDTCMYCLVSKEFKFDSTLTADKGNLKDNAKYTAHCRRCGCKHYLIADEGTFKFMPGDYMDQMGKRIEITEVENEK